LFTSVYRHGCRSHPAQDHLYNSGWLIETVHEIILIDYVPSEKLNLDSILFNNFKEAKAANKKSYILITHEHADHFYKSLLQWHLQLTGLTTILGWDYPTGDKSILKVFNRKSLTAGTLKITAHPSTDVGSGFLLEVGTLTIYHAGDHAVWSDDLTQKFIDELQFIKKYTQQIDVAFLPIARGKLGNCKVIESITKGNMTALKILKPKTFFPMHLQCDDLRPYDDFTKLVNKEFPDIITEAPRSYHSEIQILMNPVKLK
jgi:L-ascorbate metabolism protein UlaG (beta-lactamase superfamily)